MPETLGNLLLSISKEAKEELLLVAPFIKYETLRLILDQIDDQTKVRCVTRWRLDEIAVGVSDIEVWNLFRNWSTRRLYLRYDLHAKLYRADKTCLIGSANLTMAALGWSAKPNYELLVVSDFTDQIREFEAKLFASAIEVDDDLYKYTHSAVESAPKRVVEKVENVVEQKNIDTACWLPSLRTPEKLFVAYQGRYDELTRVAKSASSVDLIPFNVPYGLEEDQFNHYIGLSLLQMPLINRIDNFVKEPRRFGEVRSLIKDIACGINDVEFDATTVWQTLMRWLLYFFPDRYDLTVPRHSEIFQRKYKSIP
jgi:hypothetical protein